MNTYKEEHLIGELPHYFDEHFSLEELEYLRIMDEDRIIEMAAVEEFEQAADEYEAKKAIMKFPNLYHLFK